MSTIADLLPAAWRARVYAVLMVANAVYLAAVPLYTMPTWLPLVAAGVNAAGFVMARANTPAET